MHHMRHWLLVEWEHGGLYPMANLLSLCPPTFICYTVFQGCWGCKNQHSTQTVGPDIVLCNCWALTDWYHRKNCWFNDSTPMGFTSNLDSPVANIMYFWLRPGPRCLQMKRRMNVCVWSLRVLVLWLTAQAIWHPRQPAVLPLSFCQK